MPDEDRGKDASSEIQSLIEYKQPLITELEDIAFLCIPEMSEMVSTGRESILTAPAHYSGLGKLALQTFAQGAFAHIMGRDVDWMEFGVFSRPDIMEKQVVKDYFKQLRLHVLRRLDGTTFYDQALVAFKNLGAFGTDVTTCTGSYEKNRVDFINWHPGDYYIGEDAGGRPDRLVCKLNTTVIDLQQMGFTLTEPQIKKLNNPKLQKFPEEIYFYYRRARSEEQIMDTKSRWELLVMSKQGDIMHESPMKSLPASAARLFRRPRSPYGLGMGGMMYRDMLQSNKIQKLVMMEGENLVNPALWSPSGNEVYREPGSLNHGDDANGAYSRRLYEPGDVSVVMALKQEIDAISRTAFYMDFFLQLHNSAGSRKTQMEISNMWQESSLQIAYVVSAIEKNWLQPELTRFLHVLADHDDFPEPPDVIKKEKLILETQFIGPLSKAVRYTFSVAQDQKMLGGVLAPILQARPQEAIWLNTEKYLQNAKNFMGGGSDIIRTPQEVEAIKLQEAAAQMQGGGGGGSR